MEKIIGHLAGHHSFTDWDYSTIPTHCFLSDDTFISSPTSLKQPGPAYSDIVLCRIPATLCLPQGEVRTWLRRYEASYIPAFFRNQAALGSSNMTNTYGTSFYGTTVYLYRWMGGTPTLCDSTSCQAQNAAWTHYCIVFYNGTTPGHVEALCVDCYIEVAGEWVKQGSTLYHTANTWKDSEINRCGFFMPSYAGHPCYADDTEIWGPI